MYVYVAHIHIHVRTCTVHAHIPLITLQSVWVEYVVSCKEAGVRAAQYSTFTALWRQLTPQIQVMKPTSDLCWVCQQNSRAIMKAANMPEEQKLQVNGPGRCPHLSHLESRTREMAPSLPPGEQDQGDAPISPTWRTGPGRWPHLSHLGSRTSDIPRRPISPT